MTSDAVSFSRIKAAFFFGILGLLTLAFFYLNLPFIYPIFWAAVLAVMFRPVYIRFQKILRRSGLAAILTELFIVVVILVPLAFIVMLIVNQSVDLYRSLVDGTLFESLTNIADRLNSGSLGRYIVEAEAKIRENAAAITGSLGTILFRQAKAITQNSVTFVLMLFLMLYALYYFFKDGKQILERIMHLSPLGQEYEEMLYERFTSTVRATMKGTFIIGIVQGFLGGLLFFVVGIKGAFVWGVIMAALSIIPGLGTPLVWVPAAFIELALGNVWQGITILIFGTLVISLADNFLRPPLVGKDIQMHPLIVLFSTLGGLLLFGISGFVIGPIIAALFLSALSMYDLYYKKELREN